MAINSLHNYVLSAAAVTTTAVTLAAVKTLPLQLPPPEALNLIANSVSIDHRQCKAIQKRRRNNDRNIIFNHFFI